MFTSAIQLHLFISLVSHKMAKNTTFAIFMIVLVLGLCYILKYVKYFHASSLLSD